MAHLDVVQAMFGWVSVAVSKAPGPLQVSDPYFGGNRGMGPDHNTAISAIAILDGGQRTPLTLRVYPSPYAAVRLDPRVVALMPATQWMRPDATKGVQLSEPRYKIGVKQSYPRLVSLGG